MAHAKGETPTADIPELAGRYWCKQFWQLLRPHSSQQSRLTASTLWGWGVVGVIHVNGELHPPDALAIFAADMQSVWGYFFISRLPVFLKCHLCLMAMLISCVWKTHSGHYQQHLLSGFPPNSLVSVICHSPIPWQLAVKMTVSTNLLIIWN